MVSRDNRSGAYRNGQARQFERHQFERDRKGNLAATEIHSHDGSDGLPPPCRSRTSEPGQWLVVALTEGSARLTVSQRLLSQVVSTPRTAQQKQRVIPESADTPSVSASFVFAGFANADRNGGLNSKRHT